MIRLCTGARGINRKKNFWMKVTGVPFFKADEHGDFKWMVKRDEFKHVLFLYNENFIDSQNSDAPSGAGSAVIRPLTHRIQEWPRAAGIPTGWSVASGGFDEINKFVRLAIDNSIERVKRILHNDVTLTEVMFSCDSASPNTIGSRIFRIDEEVVQYISDKLQELQDYDREASPKTHNVIDANESVLMIHAKLHQRVAHLENELRTANSRKRPADFSNLRQASISRFF